MVMKHTPHIPSKSETKAESTTKFAMALIDKETTERAAKIQRLRAARLEHEAAQAPVAAAKPKRKRATAQ